MGGSTSNAFNGNSGNPMFKGFQSATATANTGSFSSTVGPMINVPNGSMEILDAENII